MFSRILPASVAIAAILALYCLAGGQNSGLRLHAQGPEIANATLSFTDISDAGLNNAVTGSHGAMFADVTGDGAPDLYLTYNDFYKGMRQNYFYRNLGRAFSEEAAARGIDIFSIGTHGATFGDLDNDGDFDLVAGLTYGSFDFPIPEPLANRMYRNDGGFFADVTPPAMAAYEDYTRSTLTFDLDRDGDLDVFAVNGDQGTGEGVPDRNEVYRNEGGMQFTAIVSGALVTTPAGQGATDTDYDGDGDIDVLAANRNGILTVLRNDGGGFTAVHPASIGIAHTAASGITSADMDNDGDFDLMLIDVLWESPRAAYERVVHLYRNVGGGVFNYRGRIHPFGGFTAGVADLDNDGDLDLLLPGFPRVLMNDGAFGFFDGPAFPGPATNGTRDPRSVAFSDIDGDGDVDFAITDKNGPAYLVRNNFNEGRWLKVRLTSANGQAGAFGAKVRVRQVGGGSLLGLREAKSSSGYLAQDDPVLHFGLGNASTVDVEVTFLNGTLVTRDGVSANQTISISGGGGVAPQLPGAPRNLTASVAGSLATLGWDAPADGGAPSQYILEGGSFPGGSNLAIYPTGSLARTLAASAPPGVYYVRVKAANAAGIGPASNEIVVQIGGGVVPPQAPVGLNVSKAGSLVTLNWAPGSGGAPPTTFVLEAGSQSGASNLVVVEVGLTTTLQTDAPPGLYFVRARARNAAGTSPPSNEVVIQIP